jgi:predicted helicase
MATLDQLISTLPTDSGQKGKAWERLCQWFLLNDPVYASQLRRVWLWDEWPGRWGADNGIDLIAEANDGGIWAIQAKGYAETTSITKADVDSFLSESNREQIAFRLLIATTDAIGTNARKVMSGQEKPASLLTLSDLRPRPIDWPEAIDQPPPRRDPYTPRAHQAEALQAISTVETGERGRVIMACGTGKTLVQLWAHEQLESHRTLVLVPSLFLVAQVMQEWTANRVRPFEFLAVCSDETVVSKQADSFVSNVSEVGVPVTTDPERIREFLDGDGDRVIFSTYQSSARIAEALIDTPLRFDLVLADEAHQLAGHPSRDFSVMLHDDLIPADRRLFFTATPRYYTGKSTRSSGESDLEVASMDNEAVFGPEVHRLSFGEAIRRDLLSDYQVVVVGITDRQAYELASEGSFVEFANNQTDARSLARQIGLAKAMHDYNLQRVISFHSRVKMAQQFATNLPEVISKLPTARAPQGHMVFDHVSGEMATGDRRNKLNRLRNIDADEYALLANARCLSEGVDVPSIDGVAFIDPRKSQIDIVQAVGRAIRKTEDKSLGTIVIPVFVPEGEDAEAILEDSAFNPVWSVVRALRDHDEELADQLDAARRKKGREGRITSGDLPPKIVFDLPDAVVGDSFIDAIVTRIVEHATSSWEEGFAHLEQYVAAHGDARVPDSFKTEDGYNLGEWVRRQRSDRSTMAAERVTRLEALPDWVWGRSLEAAWEEGFAHLAQYVAAHGDARVPQRFKTEDGYKLGTWVQSQRNTRSTMSTERLTRLEGLGFVWDARPGA